jgi:hypothetical protein
MGIYIRKPDGSYVKIEDEAAPIGYGFNVDYDTIALYIENGTINFGTAIELIKNVGSAKAAKIFGSTNISLDTVYSILTHDGLTTDYMQAILYDMIELGYVERVIDVITYTAADSTVSADTTISGVNRYANLTIDAGVTLTVDGQPGVIIANSISNSGTILKTATGGTGGATYSGVGDGGAGGGGLIIIAKSYSGGTVSADGIGGESGSTTGAYGCGSGGSGGYMIVVGTDSPGNGGNGGKSGTSNYCAGDGLGGTPGAGGGGGARYPVDPYYFGGGNGGTISLETRSSYLEVYNESLKAAVDWFIVNVLGRTPTTTTNFYNCYGAGGGGGSDCADMADGGGGGGSGGYILLCTGDLNGGTFTALGGAGGAGGTEGGYDTGGGGGGGGIVYILYKNLVAAPTIDVSGGAGGTGDISGGAGTAGTGVYVQV